jgi:hypothetical protein
VEYTLGQRMEKHPAGDTSPAPWKLKAKTWSSSSLYACCCCSDAESQKFILPLNRRFRNQDSGRLKKKANSNNSIASTDEEGSFGRKRKHG